MKSKIKQGLLILSILSFLAILATSCAKEETQPNSAACIVFVSHSVINTNYKYKYNILGCEQTDYNPTTQKYETYRNHGIVYSNKTFQDGVILYAPFSKQDSIIN